MSKTRYLALVLALLLGLFLVACGSSDSDSADEPASTSEEAEAPAEEAAADEEMAADEEAAMEEDTAASEDMADEAMGDRVQIRWFVGLGTGTDPVQIEIQEEVVADFNASQDNIELVLEVVPFDAAKDTLSTQIASGSGPDIIGPVGWGGSNAYFGQYLDLAPYIEASGFDTSIFDPELIKFYQTEEGQVGLPFAVFPGAMYYVPAMFDEVGLAYPPQVYGEKYELDGEMVDWTWDVVTEIARRLTIDANGYTALDEEFDPEQIVQVGYEPQWQGISSIGTFYGGPSYYYTGEAQGEYEAAIPEEWIEAWRWYYDGMYGDQPFIATGPLAGAPEFGNGNPFNSGKAAMGLTQTWYTCCLGDLRDAGVEFQMGIQPISADGETHGRIDADTFRVWKGTQHPQEAFDVLAYLITTGGDKLLPTYGAMPAIAEKTDAFFEAKGADYPSVTPESWDVFIQGLAYPDIPSAESYTPNWVEGFARLETFKGLLANTPDLDFDAEVQKLSDDLTVIFNK
ncbi:MAG: extracellular solute-binding protein [Anaerolineae bacterium]|nr:extracellular solute-binding protein [Anaerolineae bacterium]MCO5189247.1 extracellular solute-binding protein [Anaerolineae bacterium]MCO5193779.1 extracellular solute-binding protein [Anaerolineae bacterium]MCO5197075.1 extracellular solute-binding protein [Anaerolineae bacterium]MCO5204639.1 extracellular solute-binding protein [Anaerolineae bacterium]